MPAHPHITPAELVLEAGVDALGGAGFMVAHILGELVVPARR
jgi:hypothetical protein